MKAIFKQTIAAAAIAVLGSAAYAQEIIPPFPSNDPPFMAELDAARKGGSIKSSSANYDFAGRSTSTRTREQVRAELAAARASGEYEALNSAVYDFGHGSVRTPRHAKAGSRDAQ